MDRQIIVYVTDKRQEKLEALLKGVRTKQICESCEKIYVLPTPVTKLDRNQEEKDKLKEELINASESALKFPMVFAGAINREWELFLKTYHIPYWDFMKMPEIVEGNAWITAEASVAEVLQLSECSIRQQKILVTGYGCCGKKIAEIFARLNAQVAVAARKEEVRSQAKKDGFEAVAFSDLTDLLPEVSTVINTVPAMVLTEKCICAMGPKTLILDIASSPGGTDFEAAKRYGVKAKLALGLPGIYTTSSSAMLLKDAISKYAPLEENGRGDKVWISQIII